MKTKFGRSLLLICGIGMFVVNAQITLFGLGFVKPYSAATMIAVVVLVIGGELLVLSLYSWARRWFDRGQS